MTVLNSFINKIICGDVLEVLKTIPDASIDLTITSPPYNMRNIYGKKLKKVTGKFWRKSQVLNHGYTHNDDYLPHDEYVRWQRACLTEMLRVIKDDGAIFYNHKWRIQKGLLLDRHDIVQGFPVRQIIIWQRNGGISFNPHYFLPIYEVIYLIAKPNFRLVPHANAIGDVWKVNRDNNNPHPAPFPLELIDRIISATNAKIILDPYMGSGTTAITALKHGRNFVGIDNSPVYVAMAEERIQKYRQSIENSISTSTERT